MNQDIQARLAGPLGRHAGALRRGALVLAILAGALGATSSVSQAAPLGASAQSAKAAPSDVQPVQYFYYRRFRPRYYHYRRFYRPRYHFYRHYRRFY